MKPAPGPVGLSVGLVMGATAVWRGGFVVMVLEFGVGTVSVCERNRKEKH